MSEPPGLNRGSQGVRRISCALTCLSGLLLTAAPAAAQDAEARRAARDAARAGIPASPVPNYGAPSGKDANHCLGYAPKGAVYAFNIVLTNRCDYPINIAFWEGRPPPSAPIRMTLEPGPTRLNSGFAQYHRFTSFGCRAPERPLEDPAKASVRPGQQRYWICVR